MFDVDTKNTKTNKLVTNNSGIELDEIDYKIISLLRKDGRMSYRTLARELGVTEVTVKSRLSRLEETNTLRVVAVTDFESVGYTMMLAIGIQTQGRSARAVAEDLATYKDVFSVCEVVGSMDIEILVVSKNQETLTRFISTQLAIIPGVHRIVPSLAINVLKNQPNWVPFSAMV